TAGRVRISIDTRRAAVAHAAAAAGATMLNDITASLHEVAAELGMAWIAMHMRGEPRTMQDDPHYDDVVAEVSAELEAAARAGEAAGVPEVWIDPGLGFGKNSDHNWQLVAHLDKLVALGWPVVVGASRKRFLGLALAASDASHSSSASRSRPVAQAPAEQMPVEPVRVEPVPVDDRREGSLVVA